MAVPSMWMLNEKLFLPFDEVEIFTIYSLQQQQ